MATSIGKWNIQTSFDASGLSTGVNSVVSAANNLRGQIGGILGGGSLGGILGGGGLAGGLGGPAGQAVSSLIGMFDELNDRGQQLARTQRQIREEFGMTRQQAAGSLQLGRELGRSPEETGSLLANAARHIGQLQEGLSRGEGGAAERALARMNIEAREWVRLPVSEALAQVGDNMQRLGTGAERAAALTALFGRRYHEMMPELERGSRGLSEATARAYVVSPADEATIRAGQAARRRASSAWSNFWDSVGTRLSAGYNAAWAGIMSDESVSQMARRERAEQQARGEREERRRVSASSELTEVERRHLLEAKQRASLLTADPELENIKRRTAALALQARSPLDVFRENVGRIGRLETDQQATVLARYVGDLRASMPQRSLPPGLEAGSAAAQSLINQSMTGPESLKDILLNARRIWEQQRDAARDLLAEWRSLKNDPELKDIMGGL